MRLVKFMETESKTVLPRAGWGLGENRELVLKWDRVSVWEEQRVSGDGWWRWLHNNMN